MSLPRKLETERLMLPAARRGKEPELCGIDRELDWRRGKFGIEDRELLKLWKGHLTVCRPEEEVKPRVRPVGGRVVDPEPGSSEMLSHVS
jgi:hypothetical protein